MAAPRGNLFAIGNNGGAPPKYETAQDLFNKIAEYLNWEDENRGHNAKGVGGGLYTLSGCALYLGFCSKASIDDQAKRGEEFSNVISRFKLFLTHWNEQKLYYMGTFAGAKIWLTNFGGYTEEVTQNQNQVITTVTPQVKTTGTAFASNESEVKG
jgi:hypothetical protein